MDYLREIRKRDNVDEAVIFIHGFSGKRDDTWEYFPTLLGTANDEPDIFTIGYDTSFMPDIVGVWSADPDLPIVADMLYTQLSMDPLNRYRAINLVAHSMGGLVVQKMLVDHSDVVSRIRRLAMFGTPSGGLKKAWWLWFWKRQIRNMAKDSEFITNLRAAWQTTFEEEPPFELMVVAGSKDQFVPPWSSLDPFLLQFRRVVPGNHLEIVKPGDDQSESFRVLVEHFSQPSQTAVQPVNALRLAAESPSENAEELVASQGDNMKEESDVVDAALALERNGNRQASIDLLQKYQAKGTDVQGTLAGRLKRVWLDTEDDQQAQRALDLYTDALKKARDDDDDDQIYYLAINAAFMNLLFLNDPDKCRELAELALQHCGKAKTNLWTVATVAEAKLYLGDHAEALKKYREVAAWPDEPLWKHESAYVQAAQVASYLKDTVLLESLEEIFTPAAREVRKIFLSYSHRDQEWMDRLRKKLTPYLREAEAELDLWVDTRIKAGDSWKDEIDEALANAGVAVLLVTDHFLNSKFIMEDEWPVLLEASKTKDLRLLWTHVSPCAYDATELKHIQAAYQVEPALTVLGEHEQEMALLAIAKEIKAAALGGVD